MASWKLLGAIICGGVLIGAVIGGGSRVSTTEPVVSLDPLQLRKALKQSDDYSRHQRVFISTAERLIKTGNCNLEHFSKIGGFMKSTSGGQSLYFTYCGGQVHIDDRIYLNVNSGEIGFKNPPA